MDTWKLNEAKSKIAQGMPPSADPDGKKRTTTAGYDKQ
jgi:hypothetical protein